MTNLRQIFKTRKGFTLIELMIVITVIAILATMVLFGLNAAQKGARDTQRAQIIKGVQTALQQFMADNGSYPAAVGAWIPNWTAAGSYLAAGPLTDPGCGQAGQTFDVRTVRVGPATCNIVTYTYELGVGAAPNACPLGTPYRIQVAKEAGGTARYCGPQ